jgi:hypothetical protein
MVGGGGVSEKEKHEAEGVGKVMGNRVSLCYRDKKNKANFLQVPKAYV